MRKEPTQARSRAKLETILNAASRLITERGLPSLGVREIARKADVNIATYYQFFPNKAALIRALLERHMQEVQTLLENTTEEMRDADPRATVQEILDKSFQYYRDNPDYTELWYASQADPELRALHLADSKASAGAIEPLLSVWMPDQSPQVIKPMSLHLVLTAGQVFRHALIVSKDEADALLTYNRMSILRAIGLEDA